MLQQKMLFNDLTHGAFKRLQVSTALARDMVTNMACQIWWGRVHGEEQAQALFGREWKKKGLFRKGGS